jgi:predicted small secreted protein
MKSRITSLGLPAALLSASLFAGCQNTARGVEQDTERNTAEVKEETREAGNAAERAADNTADAAKNAADRAGDAAGNVADETKDAARSMGATVDAAQQTLQIKTALIDADNIDAAGIDVDTNASTKTVTLKGHVPTSMQKAAAEQVAKDKAPSYRVVNELVVRS